jgi:hypothetical protein
MRKGTYTNVVIKIKLSGYLDIVLSFPLFHYFVDEKL